MMVRGLAAGAAAVVLSATAVFAATKTVDLDAQPTNGAESKCDLNVLSSFPVKIENVVTNKAVGEAFDFTWASAGPAGFTSSVTPGTLGGVGARWTWTTNQTVYSYTGNSCDRDICFLQTAGPDVGGNCSLGCLDDGVALTAARGTAGAVNLTWTGGTAAYTVYRSPVASLITAPASALTTSSLLAATDTPPAGTIFYYRVRGATCNTLKPCSSNAQCLPASEGICVTRGPFAVPGRSLSATDITVSAASLTSSLVTFFSPPKEVFRVTITAQPGGSFETVTNQSPETMTVETEAFPPGCCPAEPGVLHPVRCGEVCVDVLNDPENCGACGNVCGDGTCCSGGECVSLCAEGQMWCDGACIDVANDSDNCGACGNACGAEACCSGGGFCTSLCELGRTYCDGICLLTDRDPDNCGTCGNVCGDGSICSEGECLPCGEGETVCDNLCVDLDNDPYNCGACGTDCSVSCAPGTHGVCGDQQACLCAPGNPGPRPLPNLSTPTEASCPNSNEHPAPVAGHCPASNPEGPVEGEAPICVVNPGTTTIAPGESQTVCRPGGLLFKEIASQISVCGDGIPGPDGACQGGISNVTTGTVMRLVPVEGAVLGDAHLTPAAVHVTGDPSGDGLMQPGETVNILVDVINAGPVNLLGASATLTAPAVDLTDDGIDNPIAPTILIGTSTYGTIQGTVPPATCEPVTLHPAAGSTPFKIAIPASFPGDSTQPLNVQFQGTVNGSPFSMTVPLAIGIADKCDYAAATGDYDGIDGLLNPMTNLVPEGDTVPFPSRALNAGNTAPLKMRLLCGGVELRGSEVDPPEIVGLSEATRGPIDISTITLNDDFVSSDPFFRWSDSARRWIFNMRTTQLGTGVFTLKIKIAGRKDYVTGFELR